MEPVRFGLLRLPYIRVHGATYDPESKTLTLDIEYYAPMETPVLSVEVRGPVQATAMARLEPSPPDEPVRRSVSLALDLRPGNYVAYVLLYQYPAMVWLGSNIVEFTVEEKKTVFAARPRILAAIPTVDQATGRITFNIYVENPLDREVTLEIRGASGATYASKTIGPGFSGWVSISFDRAPERILAAVLLVNGEVAAWRPIHHPPVFTRETAAEMRRFGEELKEMGLAKQVVLPVRKPTKPVQRAVEKHVGERAGEAAPARPATPPSVPETVEQVRVGPRRIYVV